MDHDWRPGGEEGRVQLGLNDKGAGVSFKKWKYEREGLTLSFPKPSLSPDFSRGMPGKSDDIILLGNAG